MSGTLGAAMSGGLLAFAAFQEHSGVLSNWNYCKNTINTESLWKILAVIVYNL